MKLISMEIKAFRSLTNQTLNFTHNCMGLVGLNEAGKSNILSAVRVLNNDHTLVDTDRCKVTEEPASIYFNLDLDNEEIESLQQEIESWIDSSTQVTVNDIFKSPDKRIRKIKTNDTLELGKSLFSVSFDIESHIKSDLLHINDHKGKDSPLIQVDGVKVPIKQARIVKTSSLTVEDQKGSNCQPLTDELLKKYNFRHRT